MRLIEWLGLCVVMAVLAIFVMVIVPLSNATREFRWVGQTNEDFLSEVQKNLDDAVADHARILKITIVSPGGSVMTALEAARLIRETSEQTGVVVEIHAKTLCASGCTVVLASGTPGHRYISSMTLFLVHSAQSGEGKCLSYVNDPKDPEHKALNVLLIILRDTYVKYTGVSKEVVTQWLTCGNEQIGEGDLAVRMGVADHVD